jgi:hypothetical protein
MLHMLFHSFQERDERVVCSITCHEVPGYSPHKVTELQVMLEREHTMDETLMVAQDTCASPDQVPLPLTT